MDSFINTRNLYLQSAPVKVVLDALKQCPDWTTETFQERVVHEMINNPRIVKNGREHEYEFSFIRKYFDILMEKDVNISDEYAMEYDRVHRSKIDSEYHFCYYPIPGTDEFLQVKLKRSFNCTAFKTWEACFAFLEWSFENKDRFIQKRIVELGSGSGLCGQMLEAMIKDCSVIMSDYCNDVAEYIQGNIEENSEVFTKLAIPCPSVTVIDFCKIDPQQWISLHADIIIATDVTFSPDLVDGLAKTLAFCHTEGGVSRSYICCTVRTIELYSRFKESIENYGLQTKEHYLEPKGIWYYTKIAVIVVLEIWKEE